MKEVNKKSQARVSGIFAIFLLLVAGVFALNLTENNTSNNFAENLTGNLTENIINSSTENIENISLETPSNESEVNKSGSLTEKIVIPEIKIKDLSKGEMLSASWTDDTTLLQNVSDCGGLLTPHAVYTLNQSVNSSAGCFTINATNITLDCAGYTINYSQVSDGNGVYTNNASTTIKNCNIVYGRSAVGSTAYVGITYSGATAQNGTIFNNTIVVKGHAGIYLQGLARWINIDSNTVTQTCTVAQGSPGVIILNYAYDINVTNNNVTSSAAASGNTGVVYEGYTERIYAYNNTITSYGGSYPFYIGNYASGPLSVNATLESNTIIYNQTYGIYLAGAKAVLKYNILQNLSTTGTFDPIYLFRSSSDLYLNHTFIGNNLSNGLPIVVYKELSNQVIDVGSNVSGQQGMVFAILVNNVTFTNITLRDAGFYIHKSNNITVANASILLTRTSVLPVMIESNSINVTIQDSNIDAKQAVTIGYQYNNIINLLRNNITTSYAYYLVDNLGGSNLTMDSNYFYTSSTITEALYGRGGGGYIIKNNIFNLSKSTASESYPVLFFSSSTYYDRWLVQNNSFYCAANCIKHSIGYSNITGNTFKMYGGSFPIALSSAGSIIENNVFSHNSTSTTAVGNYWIGTSIASSHNRFYGNLYNYTPHPSIGGNYISGYVTNNTFSNERYLSTGGTWGGAFSYPFYVYYNSNGSLSDIVMNSSTIGVEFFYQAGINHGTYNLTNVTRPDGSAIRINYSVGVNITTIVNWYMDVNVTNKQGVALEGANVTVYNNTGGLLFSNLTDANGLTALYTIQEYSKVNRSTTYFQTPLTINITLGNYSDYTNATVNLTRNLRINSEMSFTPPAINFTDTTPSNGSAQITNSALVTVNSSDDLGLTNISTFIDLDNSILAWIRMDDLNSSGDVVDYFGKYNGTKYGGASQIANGKMGKAFSLPGNGAINFSYDFGSHVNISVSFWMNTTAGLRTIMCSGPATSSPRLLLRTNADSTISSYRGGYAVSTGKISDNSWIHVSVVYNSTTACFYFNGTLSNCAAQTTTETAQTAFYIGNGFNGFFNGSIDDVIIFNRTITSNEVQALYANQSSHYFSANLTNLASSSHTIKAYSQNSLGSVNTTETRTFIVDATAPNITTLLPTDNFYTNASEYNFTANATDNSGLLNATLYIYNETGLFTSVSTTITGTVQLIGNLISSLVDGIYTFFWKVFDLAGSSFTNTNQTVIVDLTYPILDFVDPTPPNNSGRSGLFYINVTITERNPANVTFSFVGQTAVVCNTSTTTNCNHVNASFYNTSNTNWIFIFNKSGLDTVTYYYYNLSITDLANHQNITETRLIRGNSAPSFASVTSSLTILDNIDPYVNITITANISDTEDNLDTPFLQWKNSTTSLWTNETMYNQTSKASLNNIWNVSITLPNYEDSFTYRIVANDTMGEIGYSGNYTLNSSWDCTWQATSDLGAMAGYSINKWVGNITINNTGDAEYSNNNCSLEFRVTYNLDEGRIYYDNEYAKNLALSSSLVAESARNVQINASFSTVIKQENAVITLWEFRGRSNQTYSNTTLTLITSQSGPYLYQKVTSSPSTVYLTPGIFEIQSYIRNLMGSTTINESNTAYNVSSTWNTFTGITNSSGNLTQFYENITSSDLNYRNINFSLTSTSIVDMTAGVKTLTLSTTGLNLTGASIVDALNRTNLTDDVSITFLCYNSSDSVCVTDCGHAQDPDCAETTVTTTTTSSSGGGGGSASGGGSNLKTEATFELARGSKQEFGLDITNKYQFILQDLKISVSGVNAEYISINPNEIKQISSGEKETIKVKITAPAYFNSKKYTLVFTIKGKSNLNGSVSDYQETRYITLLILEIDRNESLRLIENIKTMKQELSNLVVSSDLVSFSPGNLNLESLEELDTLANLSYENGDFVALKDYYSQIEEIYNSAIKSRDLFEELSKQIKEAESSGIAVTETKKIFYLAESAFSRGDFNLALKRLEEARLAYAAEVKGEFNLLYTVKNNPIQSTGYIAGFGVFVISTSLLVRYRLYKRKLRILGEEEKLLLELMKVVQKECFENNSMSMEEYREAMAQYERRLGEVVEDRIRVETKLANLLKIKGKKRALKEESKRLSDMIKKLQDQYLNKGQLETRLYENMLKSYSTKLSEVEEELALLDAAEAVGNKNIKLKSFKK